MSDGGVAAVCFDLDDTLYPYRAYAASGLLAAADRLEAETGQSHHERLLALYFEEGVTDGTFDTLLARADLPAELAPELVEAFHAATTALSPYPDAVAVLSTLSSSRPLGLITDGRGGHAKLDRLDIRHFFDAVLVTPRIDASKRDPAVFETVGERLSVPLSATAYVGDDPRFDSPVPNALGMTTVRVRRGRYTDREPASDAGRPDYEIESLDELPAVLGLAGD